MNARGTALDAQSAWLVFDDHPVRAVLDFESGIASYEEVPSLLRLYPAGKRAVAQLVIRFTDGADVVPPIDTTAAVLWLHAVDGMSLELRVERCCGPGRVTASCWLHGGNPENLLAAQSRTIQRLLVERVLTVSHGN